MAIFGDKESNSTPVTCPSRSDTNPTQSPVAGNLTFHQLITIISGACTILACLLSFYLIFRHATHYSLPKEQRQIIRIVFMIPVFAAVSFASVAWYDGAEYLKPIGALYEAFALASFFLLLCAFIHEDEDEQQNFITASGAMKQHRAAAIGSFQFPVVMLVVLVATEFSEAKGTYCSTSNNIHFAHIWCTIITLVSTIIAIASILKFYKALKPIINHRKPLPKLIGFKAIVFMSFIQTILFSFLTSSSHLTPSDHATFDDLSIGIPNLLLTIEMAIFAAAFLYVYRTREYIYKPSAPSAVPLGHGGYQGGFLGLKAYIEAINIGDILRGIISVPALLFNRKRRSGGRGKANIPSRESYTNIEMASDAHPSNFPRAHFDGDNQHSDLDLEERQHTDAPLYDPTRPLVQSDERRGV